MAIGAGRHTVELAAAQREEGCAASPTPPACWLLPNIARPGALRGFVARSVAAIDAGNAPGRESGAGGGGGWAELDSFWHFLISVSAGFACPAETCAP